MAHNLKGHLAQVDMSQFGDAPESWTEEDQEDPGQWITNPSEYKDPEEDAKSLAKQWLGDMVHIGPELYIDKSTAKLLQAVKGLGLPMATKEDMLEVMDLFMDQTSLYEHISWFNDVEWEYLLTWLDSNTKVAMIFLAQTTEMIDLLAYLHSLGFEIADGSAKTQKLLLKLVEAGNPAATQIVGLGPSEMASLFDQLDIKLFGPRPSPQQPSTPLTPSQDPITPPSAQETAPQQVPVAPPQPGIPEDPTSDDDTLEQFNVLPVPAREFGTGAQGKSKQVADFSERYEDMIKGLPEFVTPAQYGSDIPNQKIWPAAGGKAGTMAVKGGMYVKDFEDHGNGPVVPGVDAVAIGSSDDGRLAVRTFPGGEFELWDLPTRTVRVSNIKMPKRDF